MVAFSNRLNLGLFCFNSLVTALLLLLQTSIDPSSLRGSEAQVHVTPTFLLHVVY